MSAPPSTFKKFRILDRISAGSMAEVYRARVDGISGFHRPYAIKRILPHLTRRPEFVEVLIEEAKIAGLLSHANIVQIMDLGQVEETYYIAMEYVDGPDLGRVLARCREKAISMPVPHAVFTSLEMLKGLEYAHDRQVLRGGELQPLEIVHRDISPSNILLSFRGEVKVSDFGIAKASMGALEALPGLVKNRLHYTSPEQVSGRALDLRADIFCTGLVLYEMLTTRQPFVKSSDAATVAALKDGRFTPASKINADIPRDLDAILERALAIDPDQRFASSTEMKEQLDQFFHKSGFIFSQPTMSTFLVGLFPDRVINRDDVQPAPLIAESADPDQDMSDHYTRPIDSGDDDPPTEVFSRGAPIVLEEPEDEAPEEHTIQHRVPPSFLDEYQDISRSSALGPVAREGDESTLIRRRPQPDSPESWGDQETVIKPRRLVTAAPERQASPEPEPEPELELELELSTTRRQRPRSARVATLERTRRRTQVAYMILGALVTGLVLWVGILLGGRLEQMAQRAVKEKGTLTMGLPDDAVVKNGDDQRLSDETIEIEANSDQMVSIGLPDYNAEPTTIEIEIGQFSIELQLQSLEDESRKSPSPVDADEEGRKAGEFESRTNEDAR